MVEYVHNHLQLRAKTLFATHCHELTQLAGLPSPVIQRADEIRSQLERTSGYAVKIDPYVTRQVALFSETNPLLDELKGLDINGLSPIEALNKMF